MQLSEKLTDYKTDKEKVEYLKKKINKETINNLKDIGFYTILGILLPLTLGLINPFFTIVSVPFTYISIDSLLDIKRTYNESTDRDHLKLKYYKKLININYQQKKLQKQYKSIEAKLNFYSSF